MTLNGYDFSHWQTDIQIKPLLSGADFIIHKASEGVSYKDPTLRNRYQLFKNKPLILYHYVRADKPALKEEISNLLSIYVSAPYPVGLALDVEYSSKTGGTKNSDIEYIKRFADQLRSATDVRVIIYMPDTYSREWYRHIRSEDLGLWIARYRSREPEHICDFWQNTSKPVDHDIFYGDYTKLYSFIGGDRA